MRKETALIWTLIALFLLSVCVSVFRPLGQGARSASGDGLLAFGDGIGVLHISGPITSSFTQPIAQLNSLEYYVQQLKAFGDDKRVKGLVIRINSPGGTVAASQELFRAVMTYKRRSKIPVVVSIADVGASGAYWVALAADTIFANPGSMVGNVGVIIKSLDLTDVNDRYGVGMNTFKSGPYKDILSSWRDVTDKDAAIVQGLIDSVHTQFVSTLKSGRELSLARAKQLADGRVYTGVQAKEEGLIDELGGMDDAVAFLAKQVGIKGEPELILKQKQWHQLMNLWKFGPQGFLEQLMMASPLMMLQ